MVKRFAKLYKIGAWFEHHISVILFYGGIALSIAIGFWSFFSGIAAPLSIVAGVSLFAMLLLTYNQWPKTTSVETSPVTAADDPESSSEGATHAPVTKGEMNGYVHGLQALCDALTRLANGMARDLESDDKKSSVQWRELISSRRDTLGIIKGKTNSVLTTIEERVREMSD